MHAFVASTDRYLIFQHSIAGDASKLASMMLRSAPACARRGPALAAAGPLLRHSTQVRE